MGVVELANVFKKQRKISYGCCGIREKKKRKKEQAHMGVVKLDKFFSKQRKRLYGCCGIGEIFLKNE